jgi:hypothetical protein
MGGVSMGHCLNLILSLILIFISEAKASEWVVWDIPDSEMSEILLGAIDRAHTSLPVTVEPLALAPAQTKCVAHVKRPTVGEDPVSNPANSIECQLLTEDGPLLARLDLSQTDIRYHGNQFSPKGFSFRGPVAEGLFNGLGSIHKSGAYPSRLSSGSLSAAEAAHVSYSLYDTHGTTPIVCTKEVWFGYPKQGQDHLFYECSFTHYFSRGASRSVQVIGEGQDATRDEHIETGGEEEPNPS